MSRETLFIIMYLLALLSAGMALIFIKDKKQRNIVLAPIVLSQLLLLAKGWLF